MLPLDHGGMPIVTGPRNGNARRHGGGGKGRERHICLPKRWRDGNVWALTGRNGMERNEIRNPVSFRPVLAGKCV